ncbi:50S ribosomal protein L22 [Flavilitoribacter nigricans]|uniref:Large ribosomal subunit protein uL22 n=1 Tax=Flavilitoribacter nigricans (strain ATCC 23147 / DSM 23189 / NBRC 102662 / NCIMB 1420 / SS-2) TaxID=1122177 RepID=A0A2D0N8P8_FLAN2|nr:50S ribosomal protein L22 [Flavilitoribacter nigricans]PHN04529.1 50S ribosomal protein L22 [Flavilitoribacter nigricans DSM 23189 = NBRC 102662]
MEAVAKLRNVPMSARKMRLVVDNIRGKRVEDALDILRFSKRESAIWLEKLVLSAVANWENKLGGLESADDYGLVIKTAFVDEGTMLKRYRPAPHGRAHRIRKRTNHVTIVVENRIAVDADSQDAAEDEVYIEEEEGATEE